jgi:hypothetical protein
MRKTIAFLVGGLLPLVGLSGIGQAQSSVEVEGTIQTVNCGAQTVVLNSPGTANTVTAQPFTSVLVNSTSVPFCSLQHYIGAPATAWLMASGNTLVATRIDVYVAATPPPVVPAPAPGYVVVPPLAGIVLGTIVIGGLIYLLVRGRDGRLYHYPYYGPYYRAYYRPDYRPYRGPLLHAPFYQYGPARRCRDGSFGRWCR